MAGDFIISVKTRRRRVFLYVRSSEKIVRRNAEKFAQQGNIARLRLVDPAFPIVDRLLAYADRVRKRLLRKFAFRPQFPDAFFDHISVLAKDIICVEIKYFTEIGKRIQGGHFCAFQITGDLLVPDPEPPRDLGLRNAALPDGFSQPFLNLKERDHNFSVLCNSFQKL